MGAAISFLDPVWSSLGTAVLHFLWQGTVIGLLVAGLLQVMKQRSPGERHLVGFAGLQLSLAVFLGTFLHAWSEADRAADLGLAAASSTGALAEPLATPWTLPPAQVAAGAWALGVLFLSLRFLTQFLVVQRLRTVGVAPAEPRWQRLFEELKAELGVARGVRLLKSQLAEVPMVVGWLSPVVLVPASAFTGIGVDQLRSLLAHELAHVRRRDPWFNAAQTVVETLLFFHPAIWWMSKEVRLEREFSCDDSSVRLTGNPRLLAEALAAMEELRPESPLTQTALGAHGGPLMQRIARILGAEPTPRSSQPGWQLATGFALAGILALGGTTFAQSKKKVVEGREIVVGQEMKEKEVAKKRSELRALEKEALMQERIELEAALKAGKLSKLEVVERLQELEQRLQVVQGHPLDLEQQGRNVQAKLDAAVASGKITQEQARERYARWRHGMEQRKQVERDFEKVWADLQAAVEAGRLTSEQARLKMAAYKESHNKRQNRELDHEGMLERIRTAVEKGAMTPAEGKAKINSLRKRWAEERASREQYEAALEEIRAAVEAGRMTEEEAKVKLEGMRRKMEHLAKQKSRKLELEEVMAQLEEAVKAGRLSRAQADAELAALRERMETENVVRGRLIKGDSVKKTKVEGTKER